MRCYFVLDSGDYSEIGYIDAAPKCGEDFCDHCGDCLHCYGGDQCYDDGEHVWIEYVNSVEEAKRIAAKYCAEFVPKKDIR